MSNKVSINQKEAVGVVLFSIAMNCLFLVYAPLNVDADKLLRLFTSYVAAALWELMVRPYFRSWRQELHISARVFAYPMVAIMLIRLHFDTEGFHLLAGAWLISVMLLFAQFWFFRMMLHFFRKLL